MGTGNEMGLGKEGEKTIVRNPTPSPGKCGSFEQTSNNVPIDKVFGPSPFWPRHLTAPGSLKEILENQREMKSPL